MALIKCSECEAEISDQAVACPKCGIPLPGPDTNAVEVRRIGWSLARARWMGGWCFFAGLAWMFFAAQAGGPSAFAAALTGAPGWLTLGGVLWYFAAEIQRNLIARRQRARPKS